MKATVVPILTCCYCVAHFQFCWHCILIYPHKGTSWKGWGVITHLFPVHSTSVSRWMIFISIAIIHSINLPWFYLAYKKNTTLYRVYAVNKFECVSCGFITPQTNLCDKPEQAAHAGFIACHNTGMAHVNMEHYHTSNLRVNVRQSMGEALQLHAVYTKPYFYWKSCENLYQYYKSRENPYQLLQVTSGASERAMKSKVRMIKSLSP